MSVKNADRLLKKLDNIASVDVIKPMRKATALVHGQAKTLCPTDTGALRGSIHMEVKEQLKNVIGRVYTNVSYASYVEFGTGIKGNGSYPYKNKTILSYRDTPWVYTPDGEKYFKTYGQVAQPYMYPALHFHRKEIKEILGSNINASFKSICNKGG